MEDKKMDGRQNTGAYPPLHGEAQSDIMVGKGAILHGIDIINSDYMIEYASRPMLQRHGELDGKTCYEVYMDRTRPCRNCPAIKAIRTMAPATVEFRGKNGRYYVISASPVTNKDGSVSAVETIVDVTERVHREEEIEHSEKSIGASEKKFRDLVEASSDWIWEVDLNGIYTYASPKVRDLLGYGPEEIIGMTPLDLMAQSEVERVGAIFREIMAAKRSFERLENVNVHKDGRPVTLETSGVPILDADGNLLGYRGIDRDISERKKAEEKLRQFSFIVEGSHDAVIMTDTERKILYVNRAAEEMLGYKAEEMLGRKAASFFEGVTGNPPHLANYIAGQAHLQPWEGEILERKKDGTVFPIRLRLDVVMDTEGSIVGYVGFSRDISEQKRVEAELKKFKTISDRANYGTAISDLRGDLIYVNDAFARMHGYTQGELADRNISFLHTKEQIAEVERLNDILGKEDDFSAKEVWHKRKDGTVFPALMNATIINDENGNPLFMSATAIDITKRKRAEEALSARLRYEETLAFTSRALLTAREGEEAMEEALRHLLVGSGASRVYVFENIKDEKGGLCMRQTHEACAPGVKPEIDNELLQHLPYEPGFSRWAETLSRGLPIAGTVEEFPESERSVLEPQDILSILVLPIWVTGRWYGFIGFDETQHTREWSGEDIRLLQTAAEMIASYLGRRQFEEALEESSSKLATLAEEQRILLEHTRDFVYRHDTRGIFTYLSPSVEQITGHPADEWKTHYTKYLTDSPSNEKVISYTEETLRTGKENPPYPVEIRHKDGRAILLEVSERPYFKDGKVAGIIGVARDITEKKRTEEALRESEARYKPLYESSRDAIMMLTPEAGFFSGNPATVEMFRCEDAAEFTSMTPADLSPEYQPDGILSTVKAQQMMTVAMEKGSHFFEWTHKRMNGDEFYATVLLTKVELHGKSFLQATVRDITERKRVEEALRASEERLRAIINTVPGGVYTAMPDKNNTKTLVSANIIEMIGYTPDEMLKSPSLWESLILSEDRRKFETAIGDLLENKSQLEIEYRVVHKDGHIVYVLDRATPILDENNNISMIEGIMVDISERKKLQEMIIQTDKLSAIGEMVAGIAHELNNPLGIISGHIQLLLARVKDRAVRSRLKKMEAHVQRGTKIIQNLLSFARKGEMETEAGDINATLEEALENVRSEIPAPNIRIVKELEPSLPQLTFDRQKMQIVFINIVKNAFQALVMGGGDGEVHVKSSLGVDSVIVRVRDTGPGVETPLIRYIIDPFFTTKKVGKGTGLGLSIAYGIVKEHGGTIQAENVKGGGFLVTIELPLHPKGRD